MSDTDRDFGFQEYRTRPSQGSLRRLLEAEQHAVYSICFHVLRHRQDAEDAAQEVLLRAVEAVNSIPDALYWRRWIVRVSVNAALDLIRRRKRRAELAERKAAMVSEDPGMGPSGEELQSLAEAIATLDEDDRSLVVGHHLEGIPLARLGRERGVSAPAIWKRLERVRARLREALVSAGCAAALMKMERYLEAASPMRAPRNLVDGAVATGAATAVILGGTAMASKAWVVAAVVSLCLVAVLGIGVPRYRASQALAAEVAGLRDRVIVAERSARAAEEEARRLQERPTPAHGPGNETPADHTPTPLPAPGEELGERLDEFVRWMSRLEQEMNALGSEPTPQDLSALLRQRLESRKADFAALRRAILQEPAAFVERLAETASDQEGMMLILLLSGELESPEPGSGRTPLHGADFPGALTAALLELAQNGESGPRIAALDFLGRFGERPGEWDAVFIGLLRSPDPRTRAAALQALAPWNRQAPPEALESLKALAESVDPDTRAESYRAIATIGTPEARRYLLQQLGSATEAAGVAALAQALHAVARTRAAEERQEFVMALRSAAPRADSVEACVGLAGLAIALPAGEAGPVLEILLRACPDAGMSARVERVLRALEAGETREEVLREILWQE